MMMASTRAGCPLDRPGLYDSQLKDAGFQDVTKETLTWPTNTWATSKKLKLLGAYTTMTISDHLEAWSMALFTRYLKWSKVEVLVFVATVRNEMRDRNIHAFWNM